MPLCRHRAGHWHAPGCRCRHIGTENRHMPADAVPASCRHGTRNTSALDADLCLFSCCLWSSINTSDDCHPPRCYIVEEFLSGRCYSRSACLRRLLRLLPVTRSECWMGRPPDSVVMLDLDKRRRAIPSVMLIIKPFSVSRLALL